MLPTAPLPRRATPSPSAKHSVTFSLARSVPTRILIHTAPLQSMLTTRERWLCSPLTCFELWTYANRQRNPLRRHTSEFTEWITSGNIDAMMRAASPTTLSALKLRRSCARSLQLNLPLVRRKNRSNPCAPILRNLAGHARITVNLKRRHEGVLNRGVACLDPTHHFRLWTLSSDIPSKRPFAICEALAPPSTKTSPREGFDQSKNARAVTFQAPKLCAGLS